MNVTSCVVSLLPLFLLAGHAFADPTQIIMTCVSEDPVAEALHMEIAGPIPVSPSSPLDVVRDRRLQIVLFASDLAIAYDDIVVEFNNGALCSNDPTRLLRTAGDTEGVALFVRNDDTCADGSRRVSGGFGVHTDPTHGLQTGSFCCQDRVPIPRLTSPRLTPVCG
jgi:hypothetical protein